MAALAQEPVDYRVGDLLRLRKPHPCGGFEWSVFRLGADIGIACATCQRRLMLPRRELERRTRKVIARGPEPAFSPGARIARLGSSQASGNGEEPA